MSNFFNQKNLAISKVKNCQFTFSKPAPEPSPVLTLGITSKGQVRTTAHPVLDPPLVQKLLHLTCHHLRTSITGNLDHDAKSNKMLPEDLDQGLGIILP